MGEIPRRILQISIAGLLKFSQCIETDLSLSKRFSKMIFCYCILSEGIFHVSYLFYYFLCDYDASKPKDNNWIETWIGHLLITFF